MGTGVVEGDGAGYLGEFEVGFEFELDLGETARDLEDRVTACSGCCCCEPTTVAEDEAVDDMPFVGDDVEDVDSDDDDEGRGDALVVGVGIGGDGDDGGSGA